MRVDRFVTTGHESLADEVRKIHERISNRITKAKMETDDDEIVGLYERIESHTEVYGQQFESVVEERNLRKTLVELELPQQASLVQGKLDALSKLLDRESSSEDSLNLLKAQANFSQAERSLLRYFAKPNSKRVNESVAFVKQATKNIRAIKTSSDLKNEIATGLVEFERIGIRAVQATRSYLFFQNVVMSGEQSEVNFFAKKLSERAREKQDRISESVTLTTRNVNWITSLTTIGAIVLSLLAAGRFMFLVIPPIAALTSTFVKLAKGETLQDIPGSNREDEIGKMAKAAQIFSDRNQETNRLLEQSELLAAQLEDHARELKASNDELDSFAYVASHDLKSPLRGIKQLASWIEEDSAGKLPDESKAHLQRLQARVSKLELLLQDLLDYSRVGRLNASVESVNVSTLIKDIVEITDNPNNVKISWPNDLPTFETLSSPLEQVFLNLIGNAIKHNDDHNHGIVEITWANEGEFYVFNVSDNGPGIAPQNHQRAFQMYQRVGSKDIDGSGMGLAIVKKQVQRLGGEISLDSSEGEGATFSFTWPKEVNAQLEEKKNAETV
jgi:signal transduction histidine kinase